MMGNWISAAAQDARSDTNAVLGYQYQGRQQRKGMRYDRYQEQRFYDKAMQRGLTPQEYYGSPVPGGSMGQSGGQVMGNALGQQMNAMGKSQAATALGVAQIQANAQIKSTEIATGQKTKELEQRIVEYENIHLPQAQQVLKRTKAETEKALNEIATSDPKFLRAIKLLSMGPANMAATIILEKYGVKDPAQLEDLSSEEKRLLLAEMLGNESVLRKEIQGVIELIDQKLKDWIKPSLGKISEPTGKIYDSGKGAKNYMDSWSPDPNYWKNQREQDKKYLGNQ